jgi:hypothetical protein
MCLELLGAKKNMQVESKGFGFCKGEVVVQGQREHRRPWRCYILWDRRAERWSWPMLAVVLEERLGIMYENTAVLIASRTCSGFYWILKCRRRDIYILRQEYFGFPRKTKSVGRKERKRPEGVVLYTARVAGVRADTHNKVRGLIFFKNCSVPWRRNILSCLAHVLVFFMF